MIAVSVTSKFKVQQLSYCDVYVLVGYAGDRTEKLPFSQICAHDMDVHI